MTRPLISLLTLVLVSIAVPPSSEAFHEVESFSRSANTGGGGGSYFTGSRASKGYECSICHLEAEQRISVQVDSPLNAGTYRPGLIYPITVKLIGEHRGLESAFNPNTFSADMVDGLGKPVGQFAGSGVELIRDRTIAIAEGFGNGETEWSFSWWAPVEPLAATLHIAMLDGDGANDPERRFIDPYHDDVATLRLAICPEGETCQAAPEPADEVSPTGCSASGFARWWAGLLLLALYKLVGRTGRSSGFQCSRGSH